MKFLCTSDWHVDATTAGVERLPEIAAYVDSLADAVGELDVDLVLQLGDSWDPGSVNDPRWCRFVYESFVRLGSCARSRCLHTEGGIAEGVGLIAIPGNHDVIDASTPTSTLSGLRVAGSRFVAVLEEPTCYRVTRRDESVAVLALPYVSRAYERTDAYRQALDGALEAALRAARDSPVVVMGHLSFDGMTPGSETTDMARGREVPFPVALIEQLAPTVVVNGHYHARQTIRRGGLDIEIVGAPIRFTFGEAKDGPRGFLVLEV